MPCTTILVGKNASYDGSTLMARNEDAVPNRFTAKKFVVVSPDEQPRLYRSVLSGIEISLPENPMRYTAMPNALDNDGIWGEAGINEANIAMSATETITSNPRVLGADPLVPNGIGEEDMVTLVLPYIRSAREGVLRLGKLLETYGTYEMNGIGFQDAEEIWWLESVGGHHWIAKRVPDDAYVVMPNQQGIDFFDFTDAFGAEKEHLCSDDMADFIRDNHLDLSIDAVKVEEDEIFDVRAAFGSHSDWDHCYNTPRAWYMLRYFNPRTFIWDGENADFKPEDNDLPWCLVPEKRISVEDIKYILSSYYQGTEYNPYSQYGSVENRGKYRPIGINRNNFLAITQLRPYVPQEIMGVEWISEGSNAFNQVIPFYANVSSTPDYLAKTDALVTTENFYWVNRIIGALADAHYNTCIADIERYQLRLATMGQKFVKDTDAVFIANKPADVSAYLEKRNREVALAAKCETDELLNKILFTASCEMKNAYARSDG